MSGWLRILSVGLGIALIGGVLSATTGHELAMAGGLLSLVGGAMFATALVVLLVTRFSVGSRHVIGAVYAVAVVIAAVLGLSVPVHERDGLEFMYLGMLAMPWTLLFVPVAVVMAVTGVEGAGAFWLMIALTGLGAVFNFHWIVFGEPLFRLRRREGS